MKNKQITPSEYAKLNGITLQAVTKRIRKHIKDNGTLPADIKKVEKFGRFYLLTIPA